MTAILALDPGSEQTGWVLYRDGAVVAHAKQDNDSLLDDLYDPGHLLASADVVVIESMAPRGMPTSAQEMETIWWGGRLFEVAGRVGDMNRVRDVYRLTRKAAVLHLTGTMRGNDANVRQALIDRFGGTGGKGEAVGVKASPGPLYGVKKDIWSALAIAVTWADLHPDSV